MFGRPRHRFQAYDGSKAFHFSSQRKILTGYGLRCLYSVALCMPLARCKYLGNLCPGSGTRGEDYEPPAANMIQFLKA